MAAGILAGMSDSATIESMGPSLTPSPLATAGVYVSVEHVAKPFKNNMLRKDRNRLSDEIGNVLFRCAQNLRHLMKAKMQVKGTVYDVVSKRGNAGR